jgi:ABC-type nitrate/sulfonate/bicarbonate transport system substrate-binding protein
VRVEQLRPNVFTLTATGQELSALVAAARMALDAMRADPSAPAEAIAILERLLGDYDAALARLQQTGGRPRRPPRPAGD